MLTLKNVVKIYNEKKKNPVCALDGISLDVPETGMLFILGKSGSGKSTLLNLIGGLDFPTDGEIIIDGKSSKDFAPRDYDGYRNSYVGFVFQEYNILDELTVEQNVALALQLQDKPNDKRAINDVLEKMELTGLNKRKPSTLSGGQRQRVAIARALIKNPKIIMADEPTGALDSKTGEQIFSVLKTLSKDRPVLVVSHDRGFAERYGDRIIELADGKILSDEESRGENAVSKNYEIISDGSVIIKDWRKITENEFKELIAEMRERNERTILITPPAEKAAAPKAEVAPAPVAKDEQTAKTAPAKDDEQTTNAAPRAKRDKKAIFAKSDLPIKHALRLAADSIKRKPIRLAFTVLLSVIAFTLFGISTALMLYDPAYSVSNAMKSSSYDSAVLLKEYDAHYTQITLRGNEYERSEQDTRLKTAFTENDLKNLNSNKLGLKFAGIIDLGAYNFDADGVSGYRSDNFAIEGFRIPYELQSYYGVTYFTGFSDCGEKFLTDNGFTRVAGRYPTNKNEIAISLYMFDAMTQSILSEPENDYIKSVSYEDIFGEELELGGMPLTICGIYDVGKIPEKFRELLNKKSELDFLTRRKMTEELTDVLKNSFHSLAFVSEDFYEAHKYDNVIFLSADAYGIRLSENPINRTVYESDSASIFTPSSVWKYDELVNFYDAEGNPVSNPVLSENDVYLSSLCVCQEAVELCDELEKAGYDNADFTRIKEILGNVKQSTLYSLSSKEITELTEKIFSVYKAYYKKDFPLPTKIYAKTYQGKETTLNVKGVYSFTGKSTDNRYNYLVSDEFRDKYCLKNYTSGGSVKTVYKTEYELSPETEKYGKVITLSDHSREKTKYALNAGQNGATYVMSNAIYEITVRTASVISQMKKIFYVAGAVMGLFAALMLFNFISSSITVKRREIGILRAVGANKTDVMKIFFTETLLITIVCFIFSAVAGGLICSLLNAYSLKNELMITILDYNALNVTILFIITLAVSFISTVFPVSQAANKPPADGIRGN